MGGWSREELEPICGTGTVDGGGIGDTSVDLSLPLSSDMPLAIRRISCVIVSVFCISCEIGRAYGVSDGGGGAGEGIGNGYFKS